MAMVVDPVCGMHIESEEAVGTVELQGTTYFFCSQACRDVFQADPASYERDAPHRLVVEEVPGPGIAEDRFTEEEVATRVGTTPEAIRRLARLGILEPEDGTYSRRNVLRARVVLDLEAMGIEADAVSQALATGDLSLGYVEIGGRRPPRSDRTFAELSEEIEIPFLTLERIYVAFGLPRPSPDELVREEDVRNIRVLPVLFGAGLSEGEVLRMVRVWGDSARKVTQYMSHYLHHTIEEPFRRRGLRDNAAFEAATREVGVRAGRSAEDLLAWLYRRHAEKFEAEHMFEHVETALEAAGVHRREPQRTEGCAFADLSGYTRLTEESGDEVAAGVSLKLAELVSEIASRHRGAVVKMLGDGVHFHFDDPHGAVMASLDLVDAVHPAGLPPAHVGVNAGPMIYDEGDYFGRTVNIAARIASQAGSDQVFVGQDVLRHVSPDGFRLVEVGAFELKGIADPLTLYQAFRAGDGSPS
jgi:adenylate cyclase